MRVPLFIQIDNIVCTKLVDWLWNLVFFSLLSFWLSPTLNMFLERMSEITQSNWRVKEKIEKFVRSINISTRCAAVLCGFSLLLRIYDTLCKNYYIPLKGKPFYTELRATTDTACYLCWCKLFAFGFLCVQQIYTAVNGNKIK